MLQICTDSPRNSSSTHGRDFRIPAHVRLSTDNFHILPYPVNCSFGVMPQNTNLLTPDFVIFRARPSEPHWRVFTRRALQAMVPIA
jgi:hypothetical protein